MTDTNTLSRRVAERWLIAKGSRGVPLQPEYDKALKALEDGDYKPIVVFGKKVIEIITPGGGLLPADWFGALGVAKRNAISTLRKKILAFDPGSFSPGDLEKPGIRAYLVMEVQSWGKAIRTLEIATAVGDTEREIKHGPFTVIPVPGVTQAQQNAALDALDAAADKIRAKFPKVLYGKIFLATHLSRKTVAHYVVDNDTVHLDVNANKKIGDIYTICHEFGHRFDYKFLDRDLKNQFWKLSTRKIYEVIEFDSKLREQVADEVVSLANERVLGRPLPKMSSELVAWLKSPDGPNDIKRSIGEYLTGKMDEKVLHAEAKGKKDAKVMTDKVLHGPLYVTEYGKTNPGENFAEAFAHYVLGMNMAPELVEILSQA